MKSFFIFLILSTSAWAEMDVPKIQVQGKCDIEVIPDRGRITFTAENQSSDQKKAVKKSTAQINMLKKALAKLKLNDSELKNTNYNVHPIREWEKEKMVHKGYRASLSLQVTTSDIPRLGETMMEASKAGITNAGALETFLSSQKSRKEYMKCLSIASEDAKSKAQELSKRLNFKTGEVIHLVEKPQSEENGPGPERAMMKSMSLTDSTPTQIEAGTMKFSTIIEVTFKIK